MTTSRTKLLIPVRIIPLLLLILLLFCGGHLSLTREIWAKTAMVATEKSDRPCDECCARVLRSTYDEMRARQLKAILKAGSLRSDPFFVPDGKLVRRGGGGVGVPADAISGNGTVDERRCLAVSAIMDGSVDCRWTDAFRHLERRLRDEFGSHGLLFSQHPGAVGGGQLHWTLMQLVGFPDYGAEVAAKAEYNASESSPYLSAEYLDCVQDSLTVGGLDAAVIIRYIGVVVVSTGLLMVGIPSLDVNDARDTVRSRLSDRNLPLKEPFVNNIVHSTLYRVVGDSDDVPDDLHLRLIALAEEFENTDLGSVVLERFQLGPASWRVLRSEVEATPPLRTWTLPVKTPREQYEDNVLTEEDGEGRGCYTVSGASGAKLARELRNVLSRQTSEVEERNADAVEFNVPPRPSTPARGDLGGEDNPDSIKRREVTPSPGLEGLKNSRSELFEHIKSEDIRDSVPRGDLLAQMVPADSAEENGLSPSWDNAATLTGAGGLALAQELQKKLGEEQRALDKMYYTDFY